MLSGYSNIASPFDWGKYLWLIGGTSESQLIAAVMARQAIPFYITVTTEAARKLYSSAVQKQVHIGAMNPAQMRDFCGYYRIAAIVDASHPYAIAVSDAAITVAQTENLPYLRYERSCLRRTQDTQVIHLENFATLLQGQYLADQRALLTVGFRPLPLFESWQNRTTLFARILPSQTALDVAINSGFSPNRLMAMRPPVSQSLETALWRQWNISMVVTKASGKAGGENIKRLVAQALGVTLIIIDRPRRIYPQMTSNIEDVLKFCHQHLSI